MVKLSKCLGLYGKIHPCGIMNLWHDRLSDFVPIASLLEWQWRRIVMRNGQFYHPSRNGPPNAEKSHTRSQSHHFAQCCMCGWVSPPPPFPPETCPTNPWKTQWGEQAPPKCRYEAIVIGRVGICQGKSVRNAFPRWMVLTSGLQLLYMWLVQVWFDRAYHKIYNFYIKNKAKSR